MYRRSNLVFRVIDSFFRHYRLFLLATVGIALTVTTLLLTREKSYNAEATVQVVVEEELTKSLGFERQSWITPAQQHVNHFNDLMHDVGTGGFVDNIFKEANLKTPINPDPTKGDPRLEAFRKKLYTGAVSHELFSIGLVWDDPKECESLVEAARKTYIKTAGFEKLQSSTLTEEFLNKEIEDYRGRMEKAEQALIKYKEENAGQTPEAQTNEIARLSDLKQERDILKITAQDTAAKRGILERRLRTIEPTSVLAQTVGQSATSLNIEKLIAKRGELLARDYTPESSPVKRVDLQIETMKREFQQEVREAMARKTMPGTIKEETYQANPEYLALTEQLTEARIGEQTHGARMGLLEKQIAEYEARVRRMPAAQRDLTKMTRDYEIVKDQYEELLKRREQVRLKANMDEVAQTAKLDTIGVTHAQSTLGEKKKLVLIAGSIILGLLVGTMLVVANEWADPTIRYEADAERMLGLPVLAALPENSEILSLPAPATPTVVDASGAGWRRFLPGQREN